MRYLQAYYSLCFFAAQKAFVAIFAIGMIVVACRFAIEPSKEPAFSFIEGSFRGGYLVMMFSLLLPMHLFGFMIDGEGKMIPGGFLLGAALFVFFAAFLISLIRKPKGLDEAGRKSYRTFVINSVFQLMFLSIVAYPFMRECDVF